jgi:hypothetical protein
MNLSLPIATAQNNHNLLLSFLASDECRLAWWQEPRPPLTNALSVFDDGVHKQYIGSTKNLRSGSGCSQTDAANFSAKWRRSFINRYKLFQNASQPQRHWRWERYCNPALKTNPINRQPKALMQPKLALRALLV